MVADKSPDAFRTISEVAEELDLPQHVLRFWETRFNQIKPLKRGGGRRFYRPDDIDLLRGIRHLLYGEGYTIRGVQRILKEQGLRFVQNIWREGAPSLDQLPREARFERQPLESRLGRLMSDRDDDTGDDRAGDDGGDDDGAEPGGLDDGGDDDGVIDDPMTTGEAGAGFGDIARLEREFDGEIDQPEAMTPPRPAAPPQVGFAPAATTAAPEPPRPNILRVPQVATGTFGTAAPQLAGARAPAPPMPMRPPNGAAAGVPQRPAPPGTNSRGDDPPPPRGVIVDPPEARSAPVMEKPPSFLDRLKTVSVGGRGDTPAPEAPAGKGQLSRDDVRKLQSILFELLECKRVLDQAR